MLRTKMPRPLAHQSGRGNGRAVGGYFEVSWLLLYEIW